jgi:hypothetical protein
MKTKLRLKLFFILILFNCVLNSQTNNIPLLPDLLNEDSMIRFKTIITIKEDSLFEYTPYIEEEIFKQSEPVLIVIYLEVLNELKSPNIIELAHTLIDSADNFSNMFSPLDPLECKVSATSILFENGDTSTVNYLFEYIDREGPDIHLIGIIPKMLDYVINNTTSYKHEAKDRLIYLTENCKSDYVRALSLSYLYKNYGNSLIDFYKKSFKEDDEFTVRLTALDLLFELNYVGLHNLLQERLFLDPTPTIRNIIADSLFSVYGSPADFKAVKNQFTLETDPTAKLLLEWSLRDYEPFPPRNLHTIEDYIIYTNSLCDTLTTYTWLGDLNFSNELKNILTTAKTNLQNGDSLACRVQIKEFQDLVDNVYKDSLNTDPRFVTIDGWKFLYWNAQYILDRLPKP